MIAHFFCLLFDILHGSTDLLQGISLVLESLKLFWSKSTLNLLDSGSMRLCAGPARWSHVSVTYYY